mmetsp:Transcript_63110/g.169222  ORF Transcript_63110/g.169222 Transcript_63110/m.169222 type:complete len:213 (-) Transcript_63110:457-1095(-)
MALFCSSRSSVSSRSFAFSVFSKEAVDSSFALVSCSLRSATSERSRATSLSLVAAFTSASSARLRSESVRSRCWRKSSSKVLMVFWSRATSASSTRRESRKRSVSRADRVAISACKSVRDWRAARSSAWRAALVSCSLARLVCRGPILHSVSSALCFAAESSVTCSIAERFTWSFRSERDRSRARLSSLQVSSSLRRSATFSCSRSNFRAVL